MICFEFLVAVFAIVAMVKVADHEGQSPAVWGFVTFGLILLCSLIPLPFVRVMIALALSFFTMLGWNAYQSRGE
ncbi:MAG: hypothetical protein ACIAXF_00110 [Phycisphaerales bacterium JB063]